MEVINIDLIDPNDPYKGDSSNRSFPNTEDLFVYVKFSAKIKNRDLTGSDVEEINFVASKITDNKSVSYITTDWTDIGGVQNNKKGNPEGFGITSINIKFGANLVPQVDITFIDVRGSSLFDVVDSENKQSPYSVFFKMPYPVFELTVKGYYGAPVTYCLNMVKWNGSFDGESGNFEIKANFIGFQFAFISDIMMGNVIGAVDSVGGRELLKGKKIYKTIKDPKTNDDKQEVVGDMLSITDLLIKISDIKLLVKDFKDDPKNYEGIEKLNTLLDKGETLLNFIGSPKKDKKSENVNKSPNSNSIKEDDLVLGNNYLSVRDYLIVDTNFSTKLKEWIDVAEKLRVNFNDFVDKNKTDKKNEYSLNSFSFINLNESDKYKYSQIKELFVTPNSEIYNDINQQGYKTFDDLTRYFNTQNKNSFASNNNTFILYYLYKKRQIVFDIVQKIKEEKKEYEKNIIKKLNNKLAQNLNFNPTIGYIFQTILGNVDIFLELLYNTSSKANDNKESRYSYISENIIDVPENDKNAYPWFGYGVIENDSELKESWLGENNIFINGANRDKFPEIQLVENILDGIVDAKKNITAKNNLISSILKSNEDSNNWLPINPLDYTDNQFYKVNDSRNLNGDFISKTLVKNIIERAIVTNSFSNFIDNELNTIALLEGSFLGKIIVDDKIGNGIKENITIERIYKIAFGTNIIDRDGDNILLSENIILSKNNNVSGIKSDENSIFIAITDSKDGLGKNIDNNNVTLSTDISDKYSESIKNHLQPKENIDYPIIRDNTYNIKQNMLYSVWDYDINKKIDDGKVKKEYSSPISTTDIKLFDGDKNLYINKIYNKNSKTPILISGSTLYAQNNQYVQTLLILNTLPFKTLNESKFFDLVKEKAKGIKLPKLYLLWIAGNLWRSQQDNDPIIWSNSEFSSISKNSYLSSIRMDKDGKNSKGGNIPLETELLNLPISSKILLIKYFTDYCTIDNLQKLLNDLNNYSTYISNTTTNTTKSTINSGVTDNSAYILENYIKKETILYSLSPIAWNGSTIDNPLSINIETLSTYITKFIEGYKQFWKSKTVEPEQKTNVKNVDSIVENNALKLSTYKHLKNLYDKWISGGENGKPYLNCNTCIDCEKNGLFSLFKFIDRNYTDISDKAVIDLESLSILSSNYNTSLYNYIGSILSKSRFTFHSLPSFINYKKKEDMQKMFTPQTTLDNLSGAPTFLCMYSSGPSKTLDIKDSRFKNDGYKVNDGYMNKNENATTTEGGRYKFAAFRVAFGSERQSIFKTLSLNQEEHKETGEYFKSLGNLIDKRGGTDKTYQGTDLYNLYSVRSYTCSVESLGCMQIQPLMYFQLDNVPFFHGTYLITSVSHSITPNSVMTSFTGVRQSVFIMPLIDESTTFLNLDLNRKMENVDNVVLENLKPSTKGIRTDIKDNSFF
jgi:hypothetical protein